MKRNAAILATGALVAIVTLVLIGAEPSRQTPTVSFSSDGLTWSSSLPNPLFDKRIRWIPGDSRTSTFHVLNETDHGANVQVFATSSNPAFVEALEVTIDRARVNAACAFVEVLPREKRRVDTTVAMAVNAGDDTQNSGADLDFVVQWDNEDACSIGADRNDNTDGVQR
ncbi:hypothetical protein [Rhodococcus sovatensis]|uniref:Secreted protein n=1 Tax=Rhodococcus sovatensis TaxID=1805840 RepID=A0ABZ2PHJ3_9NOCA